MVNQRYLKLTAYFGERQRVGGSTRGFLADAILDLFGSHGIATSVMLRGIASFGPTNVLRTDGSLSLSEDLPVVITAVDTEERIAPLADLIVALTGRGMVTLERAGLVSSDSDLEALNELDNPAWDAAKLTVYVGRQARMDGQLASYAICDLMHRHGFAGATVHLGVDGTAHGERRRARFFAHNVDVPMMIIGMGSPTAASAVAGELARVVPHLLLTVERVRLCKRDGALLARPPSIPPADDQDRDLCQKLMIYTTEGTLHDGLPIHRQIVSRLMASKSARGATSMRGVWGFHGDHRPHGDNIFRLSRGVPVTTIVVDTPAAIARSFELIDEVTEQHGLVTCELVPAAVTLNETGRAGGGTTLARYDY